MTRKGSSGRSLYIPTSGKQFVLKQARAISSAPKNKYSGYYQASRLKPLTTDIILSENFESLSENEITPFDAGYDDLVKQENTKHLEVQKVVAEMQDRFNKEPEVESVSDKKRRATFAEEYGIIGDEYGNLVKTLGGNLFHMLKESTHLDSSQIMDVVHDYNGYANAKDIEHALLTLIAKINSEYAYSVEIIQDAMQLGFSLDDALYLTKSDVPRDFEPIKGVSALRDIIESEVGIKEKKQLKEKIWKRYGKE